MHNGLGRDALFARQARQDGAVQRWHSLEKVAGLAKDHDAGVFASSFWGSVLPDRCMATHGARMPLESRAHPE
jgi:hypothetical protein